MKLARSLYLRQLPVFDSLKNECYELIAYSNKVSIYARAPALKAMRTDSIQPGEYIRLIAVGIIYGTQCEIENLKSLYKR